MTVTVLDAFPGAGTALDPAKWTTYTESFASWTSSVTQDSGRMRQSATSASPDTGYHKVSAASVARFTNGEVRGSFTLSTSVPNLLQFSTHSSEPYLAAYRIAAIDGYIVSYRFDGQLLLLRSVGENEVTLATVAGTPLAAGQTWRLAIRVQSGRVQAWVWAGNAVRPSTPTFTAYDDRFVTGGVRMGFQSGDPGTTQVVHWADLEYDDLGEAVAWVEDANKPSGAVAVGALYDQVLRPQNFSPGSITYDGAGLLRLFADFNAGSNSFRLRTTYNATPTHLRIRYAQRTLDTEFKFGGVQFHGSGIPAFGDATKAGDDESYFVSHRPREQILVLERNENSSFVLVGSQSVVEAEYTVGSTVEIVIDTIRAADNVTVKVKHWKQGTPEPTTGGTDNDGYQLKYVDTTAKRQLGSRVAILGYTGSATAQTQAVESLTIAAVTAAGTAAPVVPANAGADQTVAPGSLVTLTGTPGGGVWGLDSGSGVTLSTPVTSGSDTKVTFTATNQTAAALARVFRYSTGSSGQTVSVDDNTLGTGDQQWEYSAGWTVGGATGASYLNTDHYTNGAPTAAVTATLRFRGTRFVYRGVKAPEIGIATVSIDGGPPVDVDGYQASRQDDAILYTSPVLADAQHTVVIAGTNRKNAAASAAVITVDRAELTLSSTSFDLVTVTTSPSTVPADTGTLAAEPFGGADGAPWPAGWTITAAGGALVSAATQQGGRGRMTMPNLGAYPGIAARRNGVDTTDVEVTWLTGGSFNPAGSEHYREVQLRVLPTANPADRLSDCYYASVFPGDAGAPWQLELMRRKAGINTLMQPKLTTAISGATRTILGRFRVVGRLLQVRVWDAALTEPTSWTLEATDDSADAILRSGTIALAGFGGGNADPSRIIEWDDVMVYAAGAAPVATASAPAQSVWNDPIPLTVTGSNFTSVLWEVVGRPAGSTAVVTNPTSATASLTPDKAGGKYTVSVTVRNASGSTTALVETEVFAQAWQRTAGGKVPLLFRVRLPVTTDAPGGLVTSWLGGADRTGRLAWTAPASTQTITGYRVGRNGAGAFTAVIPATARSYDFPGLVASTTYSLTVAAVLSGGGEGPTAAASLAVPADPSTSATTVFPKAAWLYQPLPTTKVLDPNSAALTSNLLQAGNRVLMTEQFADPIYFAATTDTLYSVALGNLVVTWPQGGAAGDYGDLDLFTAELRIPAGAVPALGSDGWLTVVDRDRKTITSLFASSFANGKWTCFSGGQYRYEGVGIYATDAEGTTERVAYQALADTWQQQLVSSGAIYGPASGGVDERGEYFWRQPLTQASASGVSIAAGKILASELEAGLIPHTLVCAVEKPLLSGPPRQGAYRYPAWSTDGEAARPFNPTGHFTMGARFFIPRSFDLGQVTAGYRRTIAKALQDYGCVIVDKGGSRVAIPCEYANTPAKRTIYNSLGLGQGEGYVDLAGAGGLPWSQMQWAKRWDGTETGASARLLP